jgi:hypothetical protein
MTHFLMTKKDSMRMRSVFIALPVLASALLLAGTPASASTASHDGRARPAGPGPAATSQAPAAQAGLAGLAAPGFQRNAVSAAGRILDDVFNSDSCTTQPDNPSITSTCLAVGFFAGGGYVDGLLESSANGKWGGNIFGSVRPVTDPLEVSCVPQQSNIPTCVAVGENYANARYPAQLVATGGANGFSPVAFRNPKGATWSVLDDVSCASPTFCILVGSAGTTRRTAHGLRYLSHASAYRWNGSALRRLAGPAPAHARAAELSGVSCPSATSCMAVGIYTSAAGRSLPYSALWASSKWRVLAARTIRGKASTVFQAVSCAAAANCVAVGDAVKPGATALAERYASGRWTVLRLAAERRSAFYSVSCPATSRCVAGGLHGTRSLIEAWNGTSWAAQALPVTAAPLATDALLHVSCVTPAICTAVGYRHNPAVRYSYRTLALGWNGSSWTIQKTHNQ